MKTAKKLALLAMVAIAGYATYSFSAISIKERDALKVKADNLLKVSSPSIDQLSELENILTKLGTTEKYRRFSSQKKTDVALKLVDLRTGEVKADLQKLKSELPGAQKQDAEKLELAIDKLTLSNINLAKDKQACNDNLIVLYDEIERLGEELAQKDLPPNLEIEKLREKNKQLESALNIAIDEVEDFREKLKLEQGDWN